MIDLDAFKGAFPKWANCGDEVLQFYAELSECLYCVPMRCKVLAARVPMLMLAHLLTIEDVACPALDAQGMPVTVAPVDACCDNEYITKAIADGQPITSASYGGFSVSFDTNGVNKRLETISNGSPFYAWLSQTSHGRMVAMILSRLNKGPLIAITGGGAGSYYGDDVMPLGHGRAWPGHL